VGEDLVSVFWTQSWIEGEIVKGRLEADGIPVDLKGVGEGPYPTGPAELFVPSRFEAQARRILEGSESASDS
jgi:Putative prokaryotic signal transducing protein